TRTIAGCLPRWGWSCRGINIGRGKKAVPPGQSKPRCSEVRDEKGVLRDTRKEKAWHGKCRGSMLLERIFSLDTLFRLYSCTFAAIQILGNYRYPLKYLNNLIEQDHRRVKQRVRPMLGFTDFEQASITLTGIELIHQIKKQLFDLSALCPPFAHSSQV